MKKIIVTGGGAAGMMAAIAAAGQGASVTLLEKNEKLGKKVFITGKGRCNVTNACGVEELLENVVTNPKFLYSAFYGFSNTDLMDSLEAWGCKLKTERGQRVFPVSDHSSDVIKALAGRLAELGVEVRLNTCVNDITVENGRVTGVVAGGKRIKADAVIVAAGGVSYPQTGSDGWGHRMAEKTGHSVSRLLPALVPLETADNYCRRLMGLSLKNVSIELFDRVRNKKIYSCFGEMLFTHFGLSGPLILSASSHMGLKERQNGCYLVLDLKPALSREQLDARLIREFEANRGRHFKNAITGLFPAALNDIMTELSGIRPDRRANEISRAEREAFVSAIKAWRFDITGTRDFNEAIITKGGISVRQVDPGSMESKLVKGLYFAGEILDLDALTGGFNLQIAWSTGHLAGISAAVQ